MTHPAGSGMKQPQSTNKVKENLAMARKSCNFDTNYEFGLPRGRYKNIKHRQSSMCLGLCYFTSMGQTDVSV